MNQNASAAQQAAILHGEGPAAVIAGPGSGKTFVITRRLNTLLNVLHTDPGEILTITYTNKAAAEMKRRAEALLGSTASEMTFGTFWVAA